MTKPFLLVNANNTNTSFALANDKRVLRVVKVPTASVRTIPFAPKRYESSVLASVVPAATKKILKLLQRAQSSRSQSTRIVAASLRAALRSLPRCPKTARRQPERLPYN